MEVSTCYAVSGCRWILLLISTSVMELYFYENTESQHYKNCILLTNWLLVDTVDPDKKTHVEKPNFSSMSAPSDSI